MTWPALHGAPGARTDARGGRALRLCAAIASVVAGMIACGGGGDDEACSDAKGLSLSLTWKSNGVLTGNEVKGKVGQPLVADPVITGLPTSCAGKTSYALSPNTLPSGPSALAPGLSLDPRTGRISGTPTQPFGLSGPWFYVQPQGYTEAKFIFNISIAP